MRQRQQSNEEETNLLQARVLERILAACARFTIFCFSTLVRSEMTDLSWPPLSSGTFV